MVTVYYHPGQAIPNNGTGYPETSARIQTMYEGEYSQRHKETNRTDKLSHLSRVGESDLDVLALRAHGASTTNTLHNGIVTAAATVAGLAVDELVTGGAAIGGLVLALENAGVHVGSALGANGIDAVALHAGVLGDIEGTDEGSIGRTEVGLEPGVVDTPEVGELGVLVERGAGRSDLGGERDGLVAADGNLDEDGGLVDVDGHAGEGVLLPAGDPDVLATSVEEVGGPVRVTEPDVAGGLLGVLAGAGDTLLLAELSNAVKETFDEILDLVADLLADILEGSLALGLLGSLGLGGGGGGSRVALAFLSLGALLGSLLSLDLDDLGSGRWGVAALLLLAEDLGPVYFLPVDAAVVDLGVVDFALGVTGV